MSGVVKKRRIERDCADPATPADLWLKLLNDQTYCDLVFVVGPERERIGAHKNVLEARSPYFKTMFSERWADADVSSKKIVIIEHTPTIFRAFLEHIYAFVFRASAVEAIRLLSLANYYDVPSLVKCCEGLLAGPFELDDLLEIFATAKELKMSAVEAKAGETMADYFTHLAKSPTFERMDEATLIFLLERNNLNVQECELFTILLRWADKQIEISSEDPKPERNDILKNLAPLVRFPIMSQLEFAEDVALTSVLTVEDERNLFLYLCLTTRGDWKKRQGIASKFPYSLVKREKRMVSLDLYDDAESVLKEGTYPNVALKKASNIRDNLLISFSDMYWETLATTGQIVSLVLEPPNYGGTPLLFQNCSEVAAENLPLEVAISCSEINTKTNKPNWISEEIVVTFETSQRKVLMLNNPWVLSFNKSKSYKITTRFLSDVYAVPDVVSEDNDDSEDTDDSEDETNLREEDLDFFTVTRLRKTVEHPLKTMSWIHFSMSGDAGLGTGTSAVPATSSSSGLHLVRSIQFTKLKT